MNTLTTGQEHFSPHQMTTTTAPSRFFNSLISSSESEGEASAYSSGDESSSGLVAVQKKSKFMYSDSDSNEDSNDSGSDFSDDDDDTDEDDDSSSEASEREAPEAAPVRKSRFLMVSDSEEDDDDDEGSGKAIKSGKEKAWDEIIATVSLINDSMSNEDWNGASITFDRLVKQTTKAARMGLPAEFFTFLHELDSIHLARMTPAEVKKLDKENAKGFNALRQKSRKVVSTHAQDIQRTLNPEAATESTMKPVTKKSTSGAKDASPLLAADAATDATLRRLQEVLASRGKKNVDRAESVATLKALFSAATNDQQRLQIVNALISFQFDLASSYMAFPLWSQVLADVKCLSGLLQGISDAKTALDGFDDFIGLPTMSGIRGSFVSYLHRIDDEFFKALQYLDPHSGDYVEFVKAEAELAGVLSTGSRLLGGFENVEAECLVLQRHLEHIYYSRVAGLSATEQVLETLVKRATGERTRQKAALCVIFHAAICGDYKRARELFTQYRFHESSLVSGLDASCQIIYNRVMVAMALAAFRLGFLKDAYFGLQELCSSGRPKELLAQGIQGQKYGAVSGTANATTGASSTVTLPSHMHLNVELIDCVFLTCSLILEVPQSAFFGMKTTSQQDRKAFQSRHLKRLMESMDRSAFTGPAENTREALVLAGRALSKAEWEVAYDLVKGVKTWESLCAGADEFTQTVLPMLQERIKEAALCTYIYSFGPSFDALSLAYLEESFEITSERVADLLTRIVTETGIPARVDIQSGMLTWTGRVELSKLQEMSMVLADKIQIIMERNQETAEFMHRPLKN